MSPHVEGRLNFQAGTPTVPVEGAEGFHQSCSKATLNMKTLCFAWHSQATLSMWGVFQPLLFNTSFSDA